MLRSIIPSAALANSSSMCATASGGNDDLVAAQVRIQRGVEDALLGDLADEHDALDLLDLEQVVDRGLVVDRVPAFREERDAADRCDRLDELGTLALARALDEIVALQVPAVVVVVDVDEHHVVALARGIAQFDDLRQLLSDRFRRDRAGR